MRKWTMGLVGASLLAAFSMVNQSAAGGELATSKPGEQKADQVVLLDVQNLWGGRDLWVSSDGKAFCRIVSRPKKGE